MDQSQANVAQQLARAAVAFEQQRTGHSPESVCVVLSGETLVITLRGALSPAERALAQTAAGAAELREFHSRLFTNSSDPLRQEIKRITGVDVSESTAQAEAKTGRVVGLFKTGTTVQVFLLARGVPSDSWNGPADFSPSKSPVPEQDVPAPYDVHPPKAGSSPGYRVSLSTS